MMEQAKVKDRRREDRFVSVLRVCCLETDSGLDFAFVRNISANGVQIEADLTEPVGAMVSYSLDDDARIAARIAWKKDGRIGLVNCAHLGAKERLYPRRAIRLPLSIDCTAWIGGAPTRGKLENISQSGARIIGMPNLPVGKAVSLTIGNITLDSVTVRWVEKEKAGVKFSRPLPLDKLNAIIGQQRIRNSMKLVEPVRQAVSMDEACNDRTEQFYKMGA